MDYVLEIFSRVALDVWRTIDHNWPFLLASVVIASAIQVYVGTDRVARWLRAKAWIAVLGAVALGALTPFCSCGTTAVVLGALASEVPWAPVVAFMVSSPLTSPEEYVLSTGLFGFSFATTFVVAAIVIGLAAGAATAAIEKTGFLVGQARMHAPVLAPAPTPAVVAMSATPAAEAATCCAPLGEAALERTAPPNEGRMALALLEPVARSCCAPVYETPAAPQASPSGCGDGCDGSLTPPSSSRAAQLGQALIVNARRLAVFFLGFAALGYLVIELIPTHVLTDYLGGGSFWSVPLAATIGIPVYLNSDASLPMVAAFMAGGMGPGAALAFLVTGAGTSVGAISGMLVIARWKVVAIVIGSLWVGAVVLGYLAPLWL